MLKLILPLDTSLSKILIDVLSLLSIFDDVLVDVVMGTIPSHLAFAVYLRHLCLCGMVVVFKQYVILQKLCSITYRSKAWHD